MVKCTHKGCGKDFIEAENKDNACQYHEGAPIFHEGLKGWSCCKKRVSDFDEFLALPGCTFGRHSTEPVAAPAAVGSGESAETKDVPIKAAHVDENGVETYGKKPEASVTAAVTPAAIEPTKEEKEKMPEVEEEDDESIPVPEGTTCKRRGCGCVWKGQATSRGSGAEATCCYHPGSPIFHEGSKGWSCCSRKVLDFDEFLKIKGCKEGKHLFVGTNSQTEEMIECRTDWYQTQSNVIFSIFAKNKDDTKVEFKDESVTVDIKMKGNKRYKKTFPLFAPINVSASKFTSLSTKVEINLEKTNGISWASFEPTDQVNTWTTFGVTGGGGTVGSTQMIYNADSPLHYIMQFIHELALSLLVSTVSYRTVSMKPFRKKSFAFAISPLETLENGQEKEEEMNKIPKSFVMRSGIVGSSVTALVRDVRRVLEPNTASHLRERRSNRLKDFVMVAGQLGVTHFLIFSRTEKNVNLRIARVPRGPTLTFRVAEYALAKDCLALQKSPKTSDVEYHKSPLLVLNNFQQPGKEFKVMTAMLQNMFPSVDVQTMQLSEARRVLLFNYNEDTGMVDMRHYSIGIKATGISKSIKRVISTNLPNLGDYEDISDYVLKEAIVSESDVEDGPESTVTLSQDYPGRNNRRNDQRAVRLYELGPRLTLELTKVENGMCGGEVLYHRYITKSQKEIKENERKRQRTIEEKAARREQQEQNVEKKKAEKEAKKQGKSQQVADEEEDENINFGGEDHQEEEEEDDDMQLNEEDSQEEED
ncbi:hypothetical protein [Parasitella parasitica]|uniref:Brix domain-containing protein n=1 Tax=Parasitella parasitica TaxID=35722 RepID=A0A0B7NJY1_9FUNG|nr:hypothetical protein [Parasitella parasitica]